MKLHYNIKMILAGGVFVFILSACTDWLSVSPLDKVLESQVYENQKNIEEALNGIYLQMGKHNLYGFHLTAGAVELIAQQYARGLSAESSSSSNELTKYHLSLYNYSTETAKNRFTGIWSDAYGVILGINNFIEKLSQTEGVMPEAKKEILLGEAYGLRAYMHLDMLRLFGPVYLTDSTAVSIPYREKNIIEYNERIAANQVMSKVIEDVNRAMLLLKDDPVIKEGPMTAIEDSLTVEQKEIAPFYRNRNRRMNYFAAGTLKVRALMYRNNKSAAAQLAHQLLEASAIPDKFPWTTPNDVREFQKEDRMFSSEVLFGVHSANMYSNWSNYFSPEIVSTATLFAMLKTNTEALYSVNNTEEGEEGAGVGIESNPDLRARNFKTYTNDASYLLPYKFFKSAKEMPFWYFQPLLRKSELYYVLAECEEDVQYLNLVRENRGLRTLSESYVLATEIQREFRREMYGEGQIFYFYKRIFQSSIPNGSGSGTVSMPKSNYLPPIPQSELDK